MPIRFNYTLFSIKYFIFFKLSKNEVKVAITKLQHVKVYWLLYLPPLPLPPCDATLAPFQGQTITLQAHLCPNYSTNFLKQATSRGAGCCGEPY